MGLITKKVEVKLQGKNIKHYEMMGYNIPKRKDNKGRISVKRGTKIIVKVEDLLDGSNVRVNVECDKCQKIIKNQKWQDYKRCLHDDKYYCNKCANILFGTEKTRKTKLNNSKSFEEWCLENNRQDILDRWDYDLNSFTPKEISYYTTKKIFFKCPKKLHKSEIKNITELIKFKESSQLSCKACNSIGQYLLNTFGSEGIYKYWSIKNKNSPWEYFLNSSEYAWFKCDEGKHEDFYRLISSAFVHKYRCPKCSRERDESFLQEKVRLYLTDLNFNIKHESEISLRCINPKTKYLLPYDNEISINKKHLIIEVMGIQHYELTGFHKKHAKRNNTTPEHELHYQKLKDRYKRIFAKSQGYFYLEIPYWTDDKDETWKKLVDDKIKEINNKET